MFNVSQTGAFPVTKVHIRTCKDPVLGRVTQHGWLSQVPEQLRPYWLRRNELTVEIGMLLWEIRVITPTKLRELVLQEIH